MRYMRKLHPYLDILVSNIGEVFVPANGKHKAHWTFGSKGSDGYMYVQIAYKRYPVHRLVAEAFIGQIPRGYQVDHISRVRDDNRVENLRIVTPSENSRNTSSNDRVDARGGTHLYEDGKQYWRENCARYRARHPDKVRESVARYKAKNPEKVREQNARCKQAKRKTHREVRFSDGKCRWVPHAEAILLLAIPLKERQYHAK